MRVTLKAAVALAALAFAAGLALGVRRNVARVRCATTLRVEMAGPNTWTLTCVEAR